MPINTDLKVSLNGLKTLKSENEDLYYIALEGVRAHLGDAGSNYNMGLNLPGGIPVANPTQNMLEFLKDNKVLVPVE